MARKLIDLYTNDPRGIIAQVSSVMGTCILSVGSEGAHLPPGIRFTRHTEARMMMVSDLSPEVAIILKRLGFGSEEGSMVGICKFESGSSRYWGLGILVVAPDDRHAKGLDFKGNSIHPDLITLKQALIAPHVPNHEKPRQPPG